MKKIFNFLGSGKVGIIFFFLIAVFSIFGTIIPQAQPHQFYFVKYGEALGKLILLLQLDDVYHSFWYVTLLLFFLLNLTICSFNRLPIVLKLYKKNPEEVDVNKFFNPIEKKVQKDYESILKFFKNQGFKEIKKTSEDEVLFYKASCRWGHFIFYIVHFSVIIIIIGAIIGAIFGFRGNVNLLEGETNNQVYLFRKETPIFLDFSLKLNKFIVDFYPNGMPKDYISNVTIIDKERQFDALIKVNAPLKYKGITFYQASYEEIPKIELDLFLEGKRIKTCVEPNIPSTVEDRFVLFLEAYMEHPNFLVAKFSVVDMQKEEEDTFIAIQGKPTEFKISDKKGTVMISKVEKTYMSVLQAKKDPAVWIVYTGFIIMILGLLGIYFGEPKTFWIYIKREKNQTIIKGSIYAKRDKNGTMLKLRSILEKTDRLDF